VKELFKAEDFLNAVIPAQALKGGYENIETYARIADSIAALANQLLYERGKVIYMKESGKWAGNWSENKSDILYAEPTHQALLINIEPIEQDSADDLESLLSEAMNYLSRNYPLMSHPEDEKYRADIAYRAKKLLEKK